MASSTVVSVVIVLPSIVPDYTAACLATISPDVVDVSTLGTMSTPDHAGYFSNIFVTNGPTWTDGWPDVRLIVVYNTPEKNLGCAGSWNLGVDAVIRGGYDWLWILSAGVRFGKHGGADFVDILDGLIAARPNVLGAEADGGLGWHCIAFPRHVLERVGRFDPIFHPAYFEDNDYSYRMQLAYGIDSRAPGFVGPLWPKVDVDAKLPEVAHGIIRSGVSVDFVELERRYVEKWGGKSPEERWTHPYNDSALDWTHVGQRPADAGILAW